MQGSFAYFCDVTWTIASAKGSACKAPSLAYLLSIVLRRLDFDQGMTERTLTQFIRGIITVWLTSCLTGLYSTKLANLYLFQH